MKKILILTSLFLIISASLVVKKAQADSKINLSVSPPITYISIKPGEEKQYEIKVENPGNSTLQITPSLLDFDADGMTGQPIIKETGTFKYIEIKSDQISFNQKFILKPGQIISIPININIPKSAIEEEYAMTIFLIPNSRGFQGKIEKRSLLRYGKDFD